MSARRSPSLPSANSIRSAIVPVLLLVELAVVWYAYYLIPQRRCGTDTIPGIDYGVCATGYANLPLYYAGFVALLVTTILYIARERKRYAATISLLAVPLSILLATRLVGTGNFLFMYTFVGHLPTPFVYWATGVLEKSNIIYLGATFIGILLITPAIFQLLHNRAYCRLLGIAACLLSFAAYAAILLIPGFTSSPLVLRLLD